MPVTWTLVCDSAGARIFRESASGGLVLLGERDNPDGRAHTRELVSDRQGRANTGGGGSRTAFAAPTDPVEHAREHFARELALMVRKGVVEGQCNRVVLVAPPAMLGELRKNLGETMSDRVVESFALDLAKVRTDELGAALKRARAAG